MTTELQRPTLTERLEMQKRLGSGEVEAVAIWLNDDGSWAAEVCNTAIIEAHTLGDLFRELAAIVEMS